MNAKTTVPGTVPAHTYDIGETVVVTIVAPITSLVTEPSGRRFIYVTPPDTITEMRIPLAVENIRVERGIPAQGEPQRGDVWGGASGRRYFANIIERTGCLYFRDDKGRDHDWRRANQTDGPLYLVHRDDAKAAGVSDRHSVPRPQLPVLPADYFAEDVTPCPDCEGTGTNCTAHRLMPRS